MRLRLALLTCCGLLAVVFLLAGGLDVTPAHASDPPRPTPTVAPGGPTVQPQQNTAPPDLVVEAITVTPPVVLVNRPVEIQVTIANLGGDLPLGNNFFVDLYLDAPMPPNLFERGTVTWGVQSFFVPAGGRYTLTYSTIFENTGAHTLYAQVDSGGNVLEREETNNVAGPVAFEVTTSRHWRTDSHEDFQSGFSNLDLSSPHGVLSTTREFVEPDDQPGIYTPDFRVSPANYVPPGGTAPIADTADQIRPQLALGPDGVLFAIWEDARNGAVDNRDVYFARSINEGNSWTPAVRVNQDPIRATANQTFPTLVYDAARDRLYALWQDNRRGNYDIWVAVSDDRGSTWVEPLGERPVNDLNVNPSADQLRPSAALDARGRLFVAWQDRRNGNDDIYFGFTTTLTDTAEGLVMAFSESVFVTDDPRITQQAQAAPSIAVRADGVVYIAWQDARGISGGDPSDVWYTRGISSTDPGLPPYTFRVDTRANDDTTTQPQYTPVLDTSFITSTATHTVTVLVPDTGPVDVVCRATFAGQVLHMAWEDWRNDNPDIYYTWAFDELGPVGVEVPEDLPEGVDYDAAFRECNENRLPPPEQGDLRPQPNYGVSRFRTVPEDPRCLAPNAPPPRPDEPSIQWQPIIGVLNDFTLFIGWSDGRNYGAGHFDLYVAELARASLNSLNYTDIHNMGIVNDNVHRTAFLDDTGEYLRNRPAAVWQARPSFAVGGDSILYVAWDDNRNEDPYLGRANNSDVYMTRLDLRNPMDGIYISPVFDVGGTATWYDIEWWGITDVKGSLTFQTRFGDQPNPPRANAARNGWTQWTGVGGTGGRYDAPGQNIRGPEGALFPRSRYIQFRANLNVPAGEGMLCASEITLNYEMNQVILPIIIGGPTTPGWVDQPNDPLYPNYQWNLGLIGAPGAWAQSHGTGQTITVIDSGIDMEHPEFAGRLLPGVDYVEDDAQPDDDFGHGTHVAGIAAAQANNGFGIAGVAPNALLRPVKVLGADGRGELADVVAAIRWSVDQGDRIINLSLGGPGTSEALRDAVDYAASNGALVIAAAGNTALNGNPPIYPAAYERALAVAAVTHERAHAPYSQTGPYVDIAAPGGYQESESDSDVRHYIWSTYPRYFGVGIPAVGFFGVSGTSQASAHVAGTAALVWSRNPALSGDQVAAILQASATDLGAAGRDDLFGSGLLDAAGAVARARALAAMAASSARHVYTRVVSAATPADFVPGELIVGMQPEIEGEALLAFLGGRDVGAPREIGTNVYLVPAPVGAELRLARELADDPRVRYAEPNYRVSVHPGYWHPGAAHTAPDSGTDAGTEASASWQRAYSYGSAKSGLTGR